MKVCHFVASDGLDRGNAFVDLINSLVEDVEVFLVAPTTAKFLQSLDRRIKLRPFKTRNTRNNPFLYLELWRIFRAIEADVVHTHFAKASGIFLRLLPFVPGKQVATKHNPRKGKVYQKIPHVIAVSEGVRHSIAREDVTVIHNGVTPCAVPETSPNSVFTLLAVGRLDPIKGFDSLIRQIARVSFPCKLLIAGEGDDRQRLEQLIDELGVQETVSLLGFRTDIPGLMAGADVQLMTSESEGFSLAMVEALFFSRLFLSTRVPGCVEVLEEKFLFDVDHLASKLQDVYENYSQYAAQFSRIKALWQEKLDVKECKKKHLELYNTMLRVKYD